VVLRLDVVAGEKLEDCLANADAVAVFELLLFDLLVVDEGAVGGAVVADEPARRRARDGGVMARRALDVELQVGTRGATNHHLSAVEWDAAADLGADDHDEAGALRGGSFQHFS
jgi:hypothetical protein